MDHFDRHIIDHSNYSGLQTKATTIQQPPMILKKPVQAIHCRVVGRAQSRFHRLIWNSMLWYAHQFGIDRECYTIPIRSLMQNVGYRSLCSTHFVKVVCQLPDFRANWNISNSDETLDWPCSSLISWLRVDNGDVEFAFPDLIKEELFNPIRFAYLDLRLLSQLRSPISVALYEWCNRYRDNPSKKTCRLPWQGWLEALCGVVSADASVRQYKYFWKSKLKPALIELNQNTDLQIGLLIHKHGRKVTDLQFSVHEIENGDTGNQVLDSPLAAKLIRLGLSRSDVKRLAKIHPVEKLESYYQLVLQRVADRHIPAVVNPAALFKYCLRFDLAESILLPSV